MKNFLVSMIQILVGMLLGVTLNHFFTSQVSLGIASGLIVGMLIESFLNKKENNKSK